MLQIHYCTSFVFLAHLAPSPMSFRGPPRWTPVSRYYSTRSMQQRLYTHFSLSDRFFHRKYGQGFGVYGSECKSQTGKLNSFSCTPGQHSRGKALRYEYVLSLHLLVLSPPSIITLKLLFTSCRVFFLK